MSERLLRALGSMGAVTATIDFETFYSPDYTLRKLTTESYVRDARFEVLGVGVAWGDRPPVWFEEWEFRAWATRVDWSRVAVTAHHAQFDALILSHHYGIKPGFIACTMSMARGIHGVSRVGLEYLAEKYALGAKGTALADFKGLRREQITQAAWGRLGAYCQQDVRLTRALLGAMQANVSPEEMWLIDSTVRLFTEPSLVANQNVLTASLADERARKAAVLDRVRDLTGEDPKTVLGSSEKFAALLRTLGHEPAKKPNAKGDGETYAFAKSDPAMKRMLEGEEDDIRFLAEARLAVKSTIVETRTERMLGVSRRGRVPMYLKYCGAHTGRWSGGDKMNPQNFNRGGKLRAALEAPPGEALIVVDSGQIEARVLPWLAGDTALLQVFRDNDAKGEDGDFYSDQGTRFFFHRPISKKETPVERQLSKNMSLGLGFGMGWAKFSGELLKGMLGAKPVVFDAAMAARFGVNVAAWLAAGWGKVTNADRVAEISSAGSTIALEPLAVHCAVAAHFVSVYRNASPRITGLWKAFDAALPVMADPAEDGGRVRMRVGCLDIVRHGLVKPGGMTLQYPGLRRTLDGFVYQGGASGRETCKVYGGLLTENAVQSLARDIVAEQALWIRADLGRESRICTLTHDEVVARVAEHLAPAAFASAVERLKTAPAWCADLPLNASGGWGKSYGSVK